MKGRPGERLVTLEYRKACACSPMTATNGRTVMRQEGERTLFTFHPGPVCDVCDAPWTLLPRKAVPPTR